jgi:hypothetical protein
MKLTNYEQEVKSILQDCTGYSFVKIDGEGEVVYELIDLHGDVDGDAFEDFDDLVSYICHNSDVDDAIYDLNKEYTYF